MVFSNQALQALEGFAANLGLPARAAPDGSYSFVFEDTGLLTFTSSRDGTRTVLSLFDVPDRIDDQFALQLLELAGPDRSTGRFLSVGLPREGGIMLAVSVEDSEMGLPTLDTCLQQLMAAREALM